MRIAYIQSLCLAFLILCAAPSATLSRDVNTSDKIVVLTTQEDATSVHFYIYFFDNQNRVVRAIEAWNGGFGSAPRADEFHLVNGALAYAFSYDLMSKEQIVEQILCKNRPKTTLKDPPKLGPIDWEMISAEGEPFDGCK